MTPHDEILARVAEVEELDAKATEGPWYATHHSTQPGIYAKPEHQSLRYGIAATTSITLPGASLSPAVANSALIARSRTLLPALAADVKRLVGEVALQQDEIASLANSLDGSEHCRHEAEAALAAKDAEIARLREALTAALPAVENLEHAQRQLDFDGCEVGVSRQAVDETTAAIRAALNQEKPDAKQ